MSFHADTLSASNVDARTFLATYQRNMLIGAEWVPATAGKRMDCIDPATGTVLAQMPEAGEIDVDRAVDAARSSFDGGVWRNMTPSARAKILWRVGDLIDAHIDELAELETLDQGKPLFVGRYAEIPGAAEQFRFFAGQTTRLEGQTIPTSINYQPAGKQIFAYTRREPVGVVAAIIPWNSPLIMAAMKLAPDLS